MARKIMLGNEAFARGAWEAGVRVASSYPGTPSTEVTETLSKCGDEIQNGFAVIFFEGVYYHILIG